MHRLFQISLALIFALSFSVEANASRKASVDEVAVFQKHYSKLFANEVGSYRSISLFIKGAMHEFRSEFGWCPGNTEFYIDCLQRKYSWLVEQARTDAVIDAIEEASLLDFAPALFVWNNIIFIEESRVEPRDTSAQNLRSGEVPFPVLQKYVARKRSYENMRAQLAAIDHQNAEIFQDDFLHQLRKNYRKKIHTLGRVDLLSYVLIKYKDSQIQRLQEALSLAIKRARSEAFYLFGDEKIRMDESEQEKLPFCLLRKYLKNQSREEGILKDTFPEMEDVLGATLITGRISSEAVRQMMQQPDFQPDKPNWGKVLTAVDSIARTLMITQPELITYYTIASIFISTRKTIKGYERQQNEDTFLFKCIP